MKSIVVYTCITNKYDWLLPPLSMPDNVHYVCYSDSYDKDENGWEVRPIPENLNSLPYNLINRYFKLFPHRFFDGYDWSVYVDGNVRVLGDLSLIIREMSENGEVIGCPAHPDRSTILEEVPVCKALGKFSDSDLQILEKQLEDYRVDGMSWEQPLTENNFIVRKHSDPEVQALMECWWENLEKYTKRDQISFPYVVWKSGLHLKRFNFAGSVENSFIKKVGHRRNRSKLLTIKKYIMAREVDGPFWKLANRGMDTLSRFLRICSKSRKIVGIR
ncbi:hypothetical protein DIT71_17010 [Marinobacter vulgaris]|uniref:TOD1/MUCI70 glycosyltransferase-like domain-containing protein n=1 Tax=Marinobacter vulgaris TaxID=1928331 RepID=A0A2V3ZJ14_9GAMM|nr:glycosyltransferase domain-containing protein [Marinobacter vulgaris]PXX88887.1 hypothetical protein DIT71_17010 [Marinobacter vulgaris]TSJ66682.1 DUF616 domain-containing protein [Marinobacter vulgaris]